MSDKREELLIGSHVRMAAPLYFEGAVQETLSYQANALMLYTGAPQNTVRVPLTRMRIEEGKALLKAHHIPLERVIVHAPYLINLANVHKPEAGEFALAFLIRELERAMAIGARYVVLHPGSYTTATRQEGIKAVIQRLNALPPFSRRMVICLETMAGKGSELGRSFEELAAILQEVKPAVNFGVCLDTCHVHDAGYDVHKADQLLDLFDHIIGLRRLHVIHLNDSQNERGAHKDRHANIGEGKIGLEALYKIAHHPKTAHIVKILETPYRNGKPPYREEIALLREKKADI